VIGLRRALVALAAAGFGFGVILALVLASSRHVDSRGAETVLALVIGWGFIGAGLYAWARRPQNNFGPLMTATGFLFFVSELAASDTPAVYVVCTLLGNLFLAVVVHMLLAMPSGRLRSRQDRALVWFAYIFASPLSRSYLFFAEPRDSDCDACPANPLLISHQPDLADAIDTAVNVTALALFGVTLAVLWRRWRLAGAAERRAVGPVMLTGTAVLVLLEIGVFAELSGHATIAELGYYATQIAILPLPYAFLASLARSRLTRGDAVSELVTRLGQTPEHGEMRDALARALGDPSLELAYWLPEFGTYADVDGRAIELGEDGGARATTFIGRSGQSIAALRHDPSLREEPDLLVAVTGAATIALENVRLNVELRARLEELRGSRARIVDAADAERRRLERNLHDGAQQRLVGVALQLRLLESRIHSDPDAATELARIVNHELTQSLNELRDLARGLHPAILEHGLGAALDALATRSGVPTTVAYDVPAPLPQPVELAAYFVACEALTNVAKYAGATEATIRAWHRDGEAVIEIADDGIGGAEDTVGSGLRGLADRVEALDGRLRVTSPAGHGTVVTAEMPCARR
jgi:signal transduction histidine kinase